MADNNSLIPPKPEWLPQGWADILVSDGEGGFTLPADWARVDIADGWQMSTKTFRLRRCRRVQTPPAPVGPPPPAPGPVAGNPVSVAPAPVADPEAPPPWVALVGVGPSRTILTEAFGNVLPESAIPARPRPAVEVLRKYHDATIGRHILRVRYDGAVVFGLLMDDDGGLRMPLTSDNGSAFLRGFADAVRKAVFEMDPFHPRRITAGHDLTTDAVGSNA